MQMKVLRLLVVACLVLGLTAAARADDRKDDKKTYKEMIVGTWVLKKDENPQGAPPGSVVEFTKDGKLKFTAKIQGQEIKLERTYSVDGDKLTSTMKTPDGKEQTETDTITKLTDKELVLKDGKTQTLATFMKK
jgi:uncharacterized protein (TIGR03066 family)